MKLQPIFFRVLFGAILLLSLQTNLFAQGQDPRPPVIPAQVTIVPTEGAPAQVITVDPSKIDNWEWFNEAFNELWGTFVNASLAYTRAQQDYWVVESRTRDALAQFKAQQESMEQLTQQLSDDYHTGSITEEFYQEYMTYLNETYWNPYRETQNRLDTAKNTMDTAKAAENAANNEMSLAIANFYGGGVWANNETIYSVEVNSNNNFTQYDNTGTITGGVVIRGGTLDPVDRHGFFADFFGYEGQFLDCVWFQNKSEGQIQGGVEVHDTSEFYNKGSVQGGVALHGNSKGYNEVNRFIEGTGTIEGGVTLNDESYFHNNAHISGGMVLNGHSTGVNRSLWLEAPAVIDGGVTVNDNATFVNKLGIWFETPISGIVNDGVVMNGGTFYNEAKATVNGEITINGGTMYNFGEINGDVLVRGNGSFVIGYDTELYVQAVFMKMAMPWEEVSFSRDPFNSSTYDPAFYLHNAGFDLMKKPGTLSGTITAEGNATVYNGTSLSGSQIVLGGDATFYNYQVYRLGDNENFVSENFVFISGGSIRDTVTLNENATFVNGYVPNENDFLLDSGYDSSVISVTLNGESKFINTENGIVRGNVTLNGKTELSNEGRSGYYNNHGGTIHGDVVANDNATVQNGRDGKIFGNVTLNDRAEFNNEGRLGMDEYGMPIISPDYQLKKVSVNDNATLNNGKSGEIYLVETRNNGTVQNEGRIDGANMVGGLFTNSQTGEVYYAMVGGGGTFINDGTVLGQGGFFAPATVSNGLFINTQTGVVYGMDVSSGGTFLNDGTVLGDMLLYEGGTLAGTGEIRGELLVGRYGILNTALYTGSIGSLSFAENTQLLFTVHAPDDFTTLNVLGGLYGLDMTTISVNFDSSFKASELPRMTFDLGVLFGNHYPYYYQNVDWSLININGLGEQGIGWYFDNTGLLYINPMSEVPEPATLLLLGVAVAALPIVRRFRKG